MTRIDLIGQRFGRLLVISYSHVNSYNNACWHCLCDCGKEVVRNGTTMRKGKVKSCGCLGKEKRREGLLKVVKTHGMSKSKLYSTWQSMMVRCYNQKGVSYPLYGGRGIKVCKRWNKFVNFYKDMGDPPKGYSLDRIDNSKGYSKKNCRWATPKEQSNNKRRNVLMEYNGKIQTRSQWAVEFGIILETLRGRLKRGWSLGDALSKPPRNRRKP